MSKTKTETLAARLKRLRAAAGLSQAKLAVASGVPLRTITNLEQGVSLMPTVATASKLAKVFAVSLDDLLGRF